MKSIILKYYPFLPLFLLCFFYAYKAIDFPVHDFANYYFGGTFLVEGHFNSDIYFPYEFNKAISDSGHKNIFVSYAPNTPFTAVCFLALTIFSLATAKLVFNSISIVLLVFSICRLFNYYKIDFRYALLIPILFLVPIKNNLLFGQVYFLLFFLLSEGWLAYEKRHWKSMSIFWSLAILLKVFPIMLVLFLVFKKQWKPAFYLTVFGFLLTGISFFFTGIDIWIFYLEEVLPKAAKGEIATAFVSNYQSVFMFLKELLVFDAADNPKSVFNLPVLFSALMMGFKIGLLTVCYFVSRRVSNALFVFSFWILIMILLSPYGSTYTFILLLFLLLELLKSETSNVKKAIFCVILFLICNVPLSLFIQNSFPFSYLRLFLLLLLFALFLYQFRRKISWQIVVISSLVPTILVLIFEKEEVMKSNIAQANLPILIYDYQIKDNQLTYFYWNEKGENKTSIPFKSASSKALDIKKNQIILKNNMVTFDNSHKVKPLLVDGKTVIYLSDYGRGIGFYTLRTLNLR